MLNLLDFGAPRQTGRPTTNLSYTGQKHISLPLRASPSHPRDQTSFRAETSFLLQHTRHQNHPPTSRQLFEMEFITTLQHKFRQLQAQVNKRGRDNRLSHDARIIEKMIKAESARLRSTGARLPNKAVTDLDMSSVPKIFELESAPTYESEFSVPRDQRVSFPRHLGKYLVSK